VFTFTESGWLGSPPAREIVNRPGVTGASSLAFGLVAAIVTTDAAVASKFAPLKLGPTVMLLLKSLQDGVKQYQ
jgi:hypothetical protein